MDIVRRNMMLITIRVKLFTSLSLKKDCNIKKVTLFQTVSWCLKNRCKSCKWQNDNHLIIQSKSKRFFKPNLFTFLVQLSLFLLNLHRDKEPQAWGLWLQKHWEMNHMLTKTLREKKNSNDNHNMSREKRKKSS